MTQPAPTDILASLEAGPWYPISDLATWLAARDLDMLGDTVRIAISRPLDPALDDTARRRMAIAAVIEETLTTSFHGCGLVELGVAPRQRGSEGGKCCPISPCTSAPKIASVSA